MVFTLLNDMHCRELQYGRASRFKLAEVCRRNVDTVNITSYV